MVTLQDYANPKVRPLIELYPERTQSVSESWQASKIVEESDPQFLAPMWARGSQHFFIREVAQLRSGLYVFILRFFKFENAIHAECVPLRANTSVCDVMNHETQSCSPYLLQSRELQLGSQTPKLIPMSEFEYNCVDLATDLEEWKMHGVFFMSTQL
jgi:hypothetical protein